MKPSASLHESFWSRRSWLLSLLVLIVVTSLGYLLDSMMASEGVSRRDMLLLSNGITGAIAAYLFFQLAAQEKRRREVVRERMNTVASLNHHVRNALQVIKYAGGARSGVNAMQVQLIDAAVNRIEWALREVLPKYPEAGDPPQERLDFPLNIEQFTRKQAGRR